MKLPLLVVAAAAAVLTYLAAWALAFIACMFQAASGLIVLPSPSSWTLRAVYAAVAVLVGVRTFRVRREQDLSLRRASVPAGLALTAVLVVSGSLHAVGVSRERHYLDYLPPGMGREAGLTYGHQACDWLAAQRWGRPAEAPSQPGPRLVYQPRRVQWHWANSTRTLMTRYLDHLDAQQPGPLTQDEREQASVIGSAWFELCPFQQWVHRPLGGSHTSD
jgi:hypothetical protein